ncbi:uncharacterized protein PGTG_08974 [Puccinia graminis f. sp. tritici CRL 75-36-700-3]|uniref:Tet-like 2OG-Fe(II) oxygenase domain-containing protein n=1 Tax=Puccinia graminis f. sp. tritici (strain CRL 75-36-700-3 / race SCCL) TaxID=418459 RepID=E3KES4_PUCGT|nr:uncharacterized protein PGTG_08974 [Puccinia graminis f. sp. tritici CRL 75-36-700-3]EFP82778.1 hypothetical protein PGTG_08974 [Puccinia graminis f. sp. tritici CRL 75-36-700-3]
MTPSPSECSLSDLESSLKSLSLASEPNDQPSISRGLASDSDDEPLINRAFVAPNTRSSNISLLDRKDAQGPKKKRIRKKTAAMKAYHQKKAQQKRPGRRTRRKRKGVRSQLSSTPLSGPLCKTSRSAEPCDLFPQITSEYRQMKEERRLAQEYFKAHGGSEPSKKTIYKRKPTPQEIQDAYAYVNNKETFQLYDYGHIRAFDPENQDQLIADIHFTDLQTISETKKADLEFLCLFLHEAKRFVNPVRSPGRSCGGCMWAIGWRKSMAKLEILGIYQNKKAIDAHPELYAKHTNDSTRAGQILWSIFHPLANVAVEANQQFMIDHNIPAFFDRAFPNEKNASPDSFFSSNLTFTWNGFFNHPHVDDKDEPSLPFAFLLSLPICKKTGRLAFESDGYDVEEGPFIFPELGFG